MAQLQDRAVLVGRRPILVRGASVIGTIAAGTAVVIALAIALSLGDGTSAPNVESRPSTVTRIGADRDVGLIDRRLSGAWMVGPAQGVANNDGPDQDIGLMDFSGR